ncbi:MULTISPECIES: fluoride efflux transporter CrcB [Stappia]|uniref:Fluoride-specific ion channel FluC n=1 Tax=Stappia taiwanensis TaxID=992267 RepID=A0A838XUI1_9HYPH|nr:MULTISPECIES: fluoride efflux transporter CrcB [Stappia]MBA4610643.1 fluoride efflux transporter CrcB [Stappia taiwanensis]MCA1300347.1 fluoride efflux transporter CrcB [Stappia indica]GGE83336.1 putative fluoride ion transporter CrcB [Stappia taiwanensis]
MSHLLIVALGGGAGAALRHLVNLASLRWIGPGVPAGTLTVNILGSFLMGALIGWLAARISGGSELRLLLATGFLGGFTTFSAFSLEVVLMWERGQALHALLYVLVSVLASVLALVAGLWLTRSAFA